MVCAEGCETAEEQSDDEVRTSQVPERSEGKTEVIKQQCLPFTVLKLIRHAIIAVTKFSSCNSAYRLRYWNANDQVDSLEDITVAIVLTVHGIETRGRIVKCAIPRLCCCNSAYRSRYWNVTTPTSTNSCLASCNSPYLLRYWNGTALKSLKSVT